jgi:methionine-gamma-lyase
MISKKMMVFKPTNKPRKAFTDGSWKDPKTLGPLGEIRWDNLNAKSIPPHSGVNRNGSGDYVVTPVITSTTVPAERCEDLAQAFANPIVAGRQGKIYGRLGHRPGFEMECALTGLHGCADTMVFSSGMAAISHTLLTLLSAGDNIVAHKTLYGCTDGLFRELLPDLGYETRLVDLRDPTILREAIDSRTRTVFFETPANPTLDLIDIAQVVREVDNRAPVIVDNTFASPFGQNPFEQGAHLVVYSMTKSIGGHTNALGGAVLGSGEFLAHLFMIRKDIGGSLGPRETGAFLNGIKTLRVRYNDMEQNAIQLADVICVHPEIETTFFPKFDNRYPLNGQMKGPGHMISFVLKKGYEGGKTFLNNLRMITDAVSLGGVETLICHPASTTHSVVPKEVREAKGIVDGLVRLSVGIEAIDDLIRDVVQAMDKVSKI